MKILVLGAGGMLGNAMFRVLSSREDWQVRGVARSGSVTRFFPSALAKQLIIGVDVENSDLLLKLFLDHKPDVVINCIGLIKQLADAKDPLSAIPINSLLPHRLARLCELAGARLVHFSTDCVFSGKQGNYRETDVSDAEDLYGKSKFLGEVSYPHAITLRTSIIGHELQGANSLVGWFLSQTEQCKGYTHAIYSGLPTAVLAEVVRDIVIARPELHGLYHVASQPINKYDLLKLIADAYGKRIRIIPDDCLKIDRSLNAERFELATGYQAPAWPQLVRTMHQYQQPWQ